MMSVGAVYDGSEITSMMLKGKLTPHFMPLRVSMMCTHGRITLHRLMEGSSPHCVKPLSNSLAHVV